MPDIASKIEPYLEHGKTVRAAARTMTPIPPVIYYPAALALVGTFALRAVGVLDFSWTTVGILAVLAIALGAVQRTPVIAVTDDRLHVLQRGWRGFTEVYSASLNEARFETGDSYARVDGGPLLWTLPVGRRLDDVKAAVREGGGKLYPVAGFQGVGRLVGAAAAAVVVGTLASAALSLGSGPPDGDEAVAEVGGEEISRKDFNTWLGSAAKSQQPPGAGEATVPDPPDFTECVRSKQRQPPAPGAPRPKPAELKAQCEQEYDALKTQVMQFLIQGEWIIQQAEDLDLDVTDAEVRQSFTEQKEQSFEKEEDYQSFLRDSGQTESMLLHRVKIDLLSQQIRDEIIKDAEDVSEEDIQQEFEENKENFGQPELRDVRVVKTDKREDADKAKREIEGGAKFGSVARKYSTDPTSKQQGGELADLQKGSGLVPQQAEDAIFGAQKDQLQGPIQTDEGFYVFQVTRVTAGKEPTLDEQTKQQIRGQLDSERQQGVVDEFVEEFERTFTDRTVCAEDFLIPQCDNFKSPADTGPAYGGEPIGAPPIGPPKEEAAPPPPSPFGLPTGPGGAPPGAPPQGAPPQGAPPQGAPPAGP